MSAYDDNITGNANCVAYWTLDGTVNDSIGTNHLSGGTAGTYVEGPFGNDQAMLFNGTTQSISTASTIDLTGTPKCTLLFWWYPNVYDTVNQEVVAEFSANYNNETTGFIIVDRNLDNDPLEIALKGDVNYSNSYYYPANFGFLLPKWHMICACYDKSAATEVKSYLNGRLSTPDATTNNNNGNNFGNHTLYIASRATTSLFANHTFAKIALFNTALTAEQIGKIYSLGVNAIKSYMKLDSSLKLRG